MDGTDGRDGMGGPVGAPRGRVRASTAAGIGAFWGLACYGVLWEGVPLVVGRPFVESAIGTVLLLPARLLLAAIHLGESLVGRTLMLGDDHAWLAAAIAGVGAGIVLAGRAAVGWFTARR